VRDLKEQFGDEIRYSFALHPPVLRALGMKRKIALGAWFRPGFRLLYAMRHLRGTRLDPFGRATVRVTERALIEEYTAAVTRQWAGWVQATATWSPRSPGCRTWSGDTSTSSSPTSPPSGDSSRRSSRISDLPEPVPGASTNRSAD
jgi:hypothetical protein